MFRGHHRPSSKAPNGPSTTLATSCLSKPAHGPRPQEALLPHAPRGLQPFRTASHPLPPSPRFSHSGPPAAFGPSQGGCGLEAESLRVPGGGLGRCPGEGRGKALARHRAQVKMPTWQGRDSVVGIDAPWRWQVTQGPAAHPGGLGREAEGGTSVWHRAPVGPWLQEPSARSAPGDAQQTAADDCPLRRPQKTVRDSPPNGESWTGAQPCPGGDTQLSGRAPPRGAGSQARGTPRQGRGQR